MKKIKKIILISLSPLFFPVVTQAAPRNFQELIQIFVDFLSATVPILVSLALIVFFWGVTMLISSTGDSKNKAVGKDIMFWGVIALFVIVSVWGLVSMIIETFGLGS